MKLRVCTYDSRNPRYPVEICAIRCGWACIDDEMEQALDVIEAGKQTKNIVRYMSWLERQDADLLIQVGKFLGVEWESRTKMVGSITRAIRR